jgi:hypothetical protein
MSMRNPPVMTAADRQQYVPLEYYKKLLRDRNRLSRILHAQVGCWRKRLDTIERETFHGWKPDEEFLKREREMVARNLQSPWAKSWGAQIKQMQIDLAKLDPKSKAAVDLQRRLNWEYRRFGVAVRPVQ